MSNETTQFINVEQPGTIEGEEIREAIDDTIGNEPNIADHIGVNAEAENLEGNEPSEITPGDHGKPEGNSKTRTKAEEKEEEFKRIVRETIEEITPHYQRTVELTQEQRDRYRQIGLIIIKRREEVSGSYGSKLLDELAEHFGIGPWSLRLMADYAKVDPAGDAIPSTLVGLSWRRVVLCAQRTKTPERFSAFLHANPPLLTLSWDEFDQLLRTEFPKKDTRGRKRKSGGTQLNPGDAENAANNLGGDEPTNPPERKPLHGNIAKAKGALDEADSELSARIKVYGGENGFSFDATFTTEAECVTVFKHFITYLEKEAA